MEYMPRKLRWSAIKLRAVRCVLLANLFLLVAATGCITDQYDLRKDVDLVVGFSPDGLLLPGESDVDIPLNQVISLKENGQLTVDEQGNYLFYKNGLDMDTCTICVGHGSLCFGTDDTLTCQLRDNPMVQIEDNSRFPDFASMTIETTVKPHYHPDRPNVGAREFIYMVTDLNVDVDVSFEDVQGIPYIDEVHYQVPGFYDLVDPSDLVEYNVSTAEPHHHSIRVKGVDFHPGNIHEGDTIGLNVDNGQILMAGLVKMSGKVKMFSKADYAASAAPRMRVHVMIGSLTTTQVKGRFHKSESVDLATITLGDLPDFIRDEEVVVDVENPLVRLTLDNGVPSNVALNAALKSMRGTEEVAELKVGSAYGTEPIAFLAGELDGPMRRSHVWLSRVPTPLPDSVRSNVVVPDMMNLIRRVPDKVEIQAFAQTDSAQAITLDLAREYKAVPRYELVAPLKLGPNMKIVYRKELKGMREKLKHADFDELFVEADVTNRIPLALEVEAQPLDSKGKVLPNVGVELPEGIPALGQCPIVFRLYNKGDADELAKLDCLAIKVYGRSGEAMAGQYLNENQNLRMEHIHITLKGRQP